MRVRALTSLAAAVSLTACGLGGPPSPPAMAYSVHVPAVFGYVAGDTALIDIDMGGEPMGASISARAVYRTALERAEGGVQVTLDIEELRARMSNPAAGPVSADESIVDGPLVFTLDRRGNVTVVSQPEVDASGARFIEPLTLANTVLPRLPGRSVQPGDAWVDTVRYVGEQSGGTVNSVSVLTYSAVGDTVVDGRSLMSVSFEGTSEQRSDGVITGMDFSQQVTGTVEGWFLWDAQRGLVVSRMSRTDQRGSMDVSVAPMPLSIRVRTTSRLNLQGRDVASPPTRDRDAAGGDQPRRPFVRRGVRPGSPDPVTAPRSRAVVSASRAAIRPGRPTTTTAGRCLGAAARPRSTSRPSRGRPFIITCETVLVFLMSSKGLPSRTTRSASLPGSIEPMS